MMTPANAQAERQGMSAPAFCTLIENVVRPRGGDVVPLHQPHIEGAEWTYIRECLDTGWVSSAGSYVDRFEQQLAQVCGVDYAIAVSSGTAALHVALLLAGVQPGDEVLTPALTFVATANAVTYCGAVPHFVDSESTTLGIHAGALADYLCSVAELSASGCRNRHTGRIIRAVIPMHTYGHAVDMDALQEVADTWGLVVVEDAAEALGSACKGKPCGSLGQVGALSFNGNKIVTTGGGGAILTDCEHMARQARHLTTTAKKAHPWAFEHDATGFNYRMPNLNAAMGCAQLEQLDGFLMRKARLHARYAEAFAGAGGVSLLSPASFGTCNHWLNCALLDTPCLATRNAFLQTTHDAGLQTRPVWTLMPDLPMYASCPSAPLEGARDLEARLICLPSGVALGDTS